MTSNPNTSNPETPVALRARPPALTKEHLSMVPNYDGDVMQLPRFIEVCDRLYKQFHVDEDPESFQNFCLLESIKSRITGKAVQIVFSHNITDYPTLREILTTNFGDKRDLYTLIAELGKFTQKPNENCFTFHQRTVNQLNATIAYLQLNNNEPSRSVLTDFARNFALRTFLHGLPDTTGSLLRARQCTSLDQVLQILRNEFNLTNAKPQTAANSSRPPAAQNYTSRGNSFNHPQTPQTPNTGHTGQNKPPFFRTNSFQRPPFSSVTPKPTSFTPKPFIRQFSNTPSKPGTSTPKNFHLIESDDPNHEKETEETATPSGYYVPGFYDGSTFHPYDFTNLTINDEIPEEPEENTDAFLEPTPEQ